MDTMPELPFEIAVMLDQLRRTGLQAAVVYRDSEASYAWRYHQTLPFFLAPMPSPAWTAHQRRKVIRYGQWIKTSHGEFFVADAPGYVLGLTHTVAVNAAANNSLGHDVGVHSRKLHETWMRARDTWQKAHPDERHEWDTFLKRMSLTTLRRITLWTYQNQILGERDRNARFARLTSGS